MRSAHTLTYAKSLDIPMYIPRFYRAACDTQPYAAQGWLELSKMEEECGQQMRAALVVRRGLEFCSLSDTLLTRTLKCAEGLEAVTVLRINKVLATLQTTSFRRLAPVLYWHPSSMPQWRRFGEQSSKVLCWRLGAGMLRSPVRSLSF